MEDKSVPATVEEYFCLNLVSEPIWLCCAPPWDTMKAQIHTQPFHSLHSPRFCG